MTGREQHGIRQGISDMLSNSTAVKMKEGLTHEKSFIYPAGLCPDAVAPGRAQEVGRHLPWVHMAQYELPWLGLSRFPWEDVPQVYGAWSQS